MRTYDVAVIGAGIIGAACAYELSNNGLRVAIVDEREVGTGATSKGMGHLVVLDDSDAQFELTRYSLQLWDQLVDELPPDCDFWRCGTVWAAEDEAELDFARRRCEYFAARSVSAQFLNAVELAELEPNLHAGLPGGLFVPGDAAIRPWCAAAFFCSLASDKGAEMIGAPATRLRDHRLTLITGDTLSAGTYVNATGTAASSLTPGLPIRSRKGHLVTVNTGPHFARHQVMELGYLKSAHASEEQDSVALAVRQREDGELLVGSSRQYGAEDEHVEPEILERMLNRAAAFMPALAAAPRLTSWTGFRAGTPDGLPLIGLAPGFARVYVASGHEGIGVSASLATARLIADAILGRSSQISRDPYSPARFAIKET